ncbi:MAG: citrate transporter, partial [Burkholderiaceae bacterium]
IAARQQHAYQPIMKDAKAGAHIEYARLVIVAIILASAVGANVWFNLNSPATLSLLPVIGMAVLAAVLVTSVWRKPTWSLLPDAFKGSVFLLSLVMCASMMPVEKLPVASWTSTLGLGFLSAVFDNIPLTALALRQGGYDWGMLAYAVGFGGSMIWFGSSAGVALSNMYPEAKSVGAWIKGGWHVAVGYVLGFAVLMLVAGWHPEPIRGKVKAAPAAAAPATPTLPASASVASAT